MLQDALDANTQRFLLEYRLERRIATRLTKRLLFATAPTAGGFPNRAWPGSPRPPLRNPAPFVLAEAPVLILKMRRDIVVLLWEHPRVAPASERNDIPIALDCEEDVYRSSRFNRRGVNRTFSRASLCFERLPLNCFSLCTLSPGPTLENRDFGLRTYLLAPHRQAAGIQVF
jgi:hypothetical protein